MRIVIGVNHVVQMECKTSRVGYGAREYMGSKLVAVALKAYNHTDITTETTHSESHWTV